MTPETVDTVIRRGLALLPQGPVLESEVEAIRSAFYKILHSPSLAFVVDDIARYLRVEMKLPAWRWATFVHVGA